MNRLENFFHNQPHKPMNKWMHYFDIYEEHFARFVGQNPYVLEIGVQNGGSLQMWKHYFGDGARVVGLDIDPLTARHAEPHRDINVVVGDQCSVPLLQSLGSPDIVIDDGGHTMIQQRTSLQVLWPQLPDGAVYMVEDTHTSYWTGFGEPPTFLDFARGLVDSLHGHHHALPDEYTDTLASIHFYDSVVVLKKMTRTMPYTKITGAQ